MITQKFVGGKELEKQLNKFGKLALAKSSVRRALKKAGQPVADKMNDTAPDDPTTGEGSLKDSHSVSTRLNRSNAKAQRKIGKADVEVYIGSDQSRKAVQQEFGNVNHPAQPYARQAWASEDKATLKRVEVEATKDVMKTAKRLEKKALKNG